MIANDIILEYILDFLSNWHGFTYSLTKDSETGTTTFRDPEDCLVFIEFNGERDERLKQAIDYIVEHYGWPDKSEIFREMSDRIMSY